MNRDRKSMRGVADNGPFLYGHKAALLRRRRNTLCTSFTSIISGMLHQGRIKGAEVTDWFSAARPSTMVTFTTRPLNLRANDECDPNKTAYLSGTGAYTRTAECLSGERWLCDDPR